MLGGPTLAIVPGIVREKPSCAPPGVKVTRLSPGLPLPGVPRARDGGVAAACTVVAARARSPLAVMRAPELASPLAPLAPLAPLRKASRLLGARLLI